MADKGATTITRQVMSGAKLCELGWKCKYDFARGVAVTLESMDVEISK